MKRTSSWEAAGFKRRRTFRRNAHDANLLRPLPSKARKSRRTPIKHRIVPSKSNREKQDALEPFARRGVDIGPIVPGIVCVFAGHRGIRRAGRAWERQETKVTEASENCGGSWGHFDVFGWSKRHKKLATRSTRQGLKSRTNRLLSCRSMAHKWFWRCRISTQTGLSCKRLLKRGDDQGDGASRVLEELPQMVEALVQGKI